MLKRWLGNCGGFTLLEVILASAILLTVLAAGYMAFAGITKNSSPQTDHAEAVAGAGVVVARAAQELAGASTIKVVYSPNATSPTNIQVTPLPAGQTAASVTLACDYTTWPYVNTNVIANTGLHTGGATTRPITDYTVTQFMITPLDQENQNTTIYSNAVQITATVAVNGQSATSSQVVKTAAYEVAHPSIIVKTAYTNIIQINYLFGIPISETTTESPVIYIDGDDRTISLDTDVSWLHNTTILINGHDVSNYCTQYEPSIYNGQASYSNGLEISNSNWSNLVNSGWISNSLPNIFTVEQKGVVPVPADNTSTIPAAVAEYQFSGSYSGPSPGGGGGGGGGGTGWQPANGPMNFVSYIVSELLGSHWASLFGLPSSSYGYLGFGNSLLLYLPIVGGASYADISTSYAQSTDFTYQADVAPGFWWGSGDTAGLVFSSPYVNNPVQGGFLYFGVRQYSDGNTYAVFGNWLNFSNPNLSSDASYVQLARLQQSGGYELQIQGDGDQFTFLVNGKPVGQETVSGLANSDEYTGVFSYPASLPGVVYSGISLTNS